mgnify:CR=1 FL=1
MFWLVSLLFCLIDHVSLLKLLPFLIVFVLFLIFISATDPPPEEQEENMKKEANEPTVSEKDAKNVFSEDELPTEEPETTAKARDKETWPDGVDNPF